MGNLAAKAPPASFRRARRIVIRVCLPYTAPVPDFALSCLLPGLGRVLGSQRESRKGRERMGRWLNDADEAFA